MCNKLYTAVGHSDIRGTLNGRRYPLVMLNGKEHILDVQEMVLWGVLNWRILTVEEAEKFYNNKKVEYGIETSRSFDQCMFRLIQRGLVAEGSGNTDEEALYDLVSDLQVIPISDSLLLRTFSFIRLTVFGGVPYSVTKQLFRKDKRTDVEKKTYRLAMQTRLTTAEIMKCIDRNVLEFKNEDQMMETLYHDDVTTIDNIAEYARSMSSFRPVLTSVANLYLRRQIIFGRM